MGQGRPRRPALHPSGASGDGEIDGRLTARIQRYRIRERGPVIVEGRAIGQKIGAGTVRGAASIWLDASVQSW